MIEAHGLTKSYGEKTAVDDLSFTVHPGIVTGFLGPNGAGKSTTMRMILGLDAPTSRNTTRGRRAALPAARPARLLATAPRPSPIPTAEATPDPLVPTNACNCVAETVMGFHDEEAGWTCARCGHRLTPAIGILVQLESPVQLGFDELVELMSVA